MKISFNGFMKYKGTYYNTDLVESISPDYNDRKFAIIKFRKPVESPFRQDDKTEYLKIWRKNADEVAKSIASTQTNNKIIDIMN